MSKPNTRKGANSRAAIDPATLKRLNLGIEESATLSEALAIDFATLLTHTMPSITSKERQLMTEAKELGVTKRMDLAAKILRQHLDKNAIENLKSHSSDTVRGWVAFIVATDNESTLLQKLSAIYPLANDSHFGVREWAWLALRPTIAENIHQSVAELEPWTHSEFENIRRFAIEITRPRGVWSKHIGELKGSPSMAQCLLENVMCDSSKYVQDSCGNWLNDAAKSNPQWVIEFCEQWKAKSSSQATAYIIKRGMRSIHASG